MANSLKRLSGPTALTTSAVTQYTVPASTSATLRNIHVCNESGTVQTFRVSVGTDGAGKRLFFDQPVPPGDPFDWSGNVPLATGEVIQALASAGTALTLVIAGVETV